MSKAGIRALLFAIVLALSVPSKTSAQKPQGNFLSSAQLQFSCSTKQVACEGSPVACAAEPKNTKEKEPKITVALAQNLSQTTITINPIDASLSPADAQLNSDLIFDLVNIERENRELAPFEKKEDLCLLAQERSFEIPKEVSSNTIHQGFYDRNLPFWAIENAKYGGTEKETVDWWMNSPIHRATILGDMKYSCVSCTEISCSQIFTSYHPKIQTDETAINLENNN